MKSIIPFNGRIAIIDDKPKEAYPLIKVLSQNNIPYIYIKGDDTECIPQEPENDIRILFLDINLLGGQGVSDKNVKGSLINIFKHVIAPSNYPYILIYWSKQEKEYDSIIKEAFENDLIDRRPIAIKSLPKSDFFPDFDEIEHPNDKDIFEELKRIIQEIPAYSYLMQWENIAHISTDKLLKEIFPNAEPAQWEIVTNAMLNSLGQAYLGQHFSDPSISPEERIKASLSALNNVFIDSIDNCLATCNIIDPKVLESSELDKQIIGELKADLNQKMLISSNPNNICEPGVVFQYLNPKSDYFENLLHKILSFFSIRHKIICNNPDIIDSLLKKELKTESKRIKQEIQKTWFKIGVVVTPSCDFAQKKKIYDRIVQGVLIESRFDDYINQGDAFYKSPIIKYDNKNYILVLNYNYFITSELVSEPNCTILFKIRHQMLAEIQSKLARHVNRQGILNL